MQYPIHVQLKTASTGPDNLAAQTEELLRVQNASPLYSFHVSLGLAKESNPSLESRDDTLIVALHADSNVQSIEASLRSWFPVLDVRYNPNGGADPTTLAPFIANEISNLFAAEQHAIAHSLNESPFTSPGLHSVTPQAAAGLRSRNTKAFKYASTYHLTFSLFTASASPSTWDVEDAIQQHIQPLLTRLSRISHLTVDTQVQLYASFSPSIAGPAYDPSTREWKLQNSDLSGFINAAEWPLSPGIGEGPTINFVLYLPSEEQTPLVLADTGGRSWLIPQWGGVQIMNPTDEQRGKLTSEDLRPVMLTFADQLTSLLGVPPSPSSLSLRVSSLTRERTTSLILSASSTLGALARLTLKLTSIAIPDLVAKSVNETIHRLDQSCGDLREGKFQSALENARIAEEEAERAFFEPSMVGQVYFPDEHKVAVYVPLLGPMAVPLIMAGLKELKKLRERRKSKTA